MLEVSGYVWSLMNGRVLVSDEMAGSYRIHSGSLSKSLRSHQAKEFIAYMNSLHLRLTIRQKIRMNIMARFQQSKRFLVYTLMNSNSGKKLLILSNKIGSNGK